MTSKCPSQLKGKKSKKKIEVVWKRKCVQVVNRNDKGRKVFVCKWYKFMSYFKSEEYKSQLYYKTKKKFFEEFDHISIKKTIRSKIFKN